MIYKVLVEGDLGFSRGQIDHAGSKPRIRIGTEGAEGHLKLLRQRNRR